MSPPTARKKRKEIAHFPFFFLLRFAHVHYASQRDRASGVTVGPPDGKD